MKDKMPFEQYVDKYCRNDNKYENVSISPPPEKPSDEEIIKVLEYLIDKCKNEQVLLFNEEGVNALGVALVETLNLVLYQKAELTEALIGVNSFKSKYDAAKDTARDLQSVIKEKDAEIEKLKEDCTKGADALIREMIKSRTAKTETIQEYTDKLEKELKPTMDALFVISEVLVNVSKSHISSDRAIEQIREKLNDSEPICSQYRLNKMIERIVKETEGES